MKQPHDSPTPHITTEAQAVVPTNNSRKITWASFGGDGFLTSLLLHGILAAVAVLWVVKSFVIEPPPPEKPDIFDRGKGGGSGGKQLTNSERRPAHFNAPDMVKLPNKISVKDSRSASVTLPPMPDAGMSALGIGTLTDSLSKGRGSRTGGGIGDDDGMGNNGKNRIFGMPINAFITPSGLIGSFYDLKQSADGQLTDMAPGSNEGQQNYVDKVRAYARSGFKEGILSPYFKSNEYLAATQFFIPRIDAGGAPQAFNVPEVKPSRWLIHYTGYLQAPKSGRFRLVGMGDDILTVYWQGKPVLDGGYDFISEKHGLHAGTGGTEPKNGTGARLIGEEQENWGKPGYGLRKGAWIDVTRGQRYKMDVLIGETPGGVFEAYLMLEEADAQSSRKGTGKLALFKVGTAPLLPELAGGYSNARCDMSGGNWIWQPAPRRGRN